MMKNKNREIIDYVKSFSFCWYRTRLYRDGTEVEPLIVDENYDFNFQETRMLKDERQLYRVNILIDKPMTKAQCTTKEL